VPTNAWANQPTATPTTSQPAATAMRAERRVVSIRRSRSGTGSLSTGSKAARSAAFCSR
jgi:hypothetical protein